MLSIRCTHATLFDRSECLHTAWCYQLAASRLNLGVRGIPRNGLENEAKQLFRFGHESKSFQLPDITLLTHARPLPGSQI